MICDTIKFKVIQSTENKNLTLQIYRPYGKDNNNWMIVDHFNELTPRELKYLGDYITSLFKKDK